MDTKVELKKAGMKISLQEYVNITLLTCLIIFILELPLLSFIFGFVFHSFLFAFLTAITAAFFLTIGLFFVFLNYPKVIIKQKANEIEKALPFATLYLSTIAGAKLPVYKIFEIFTQFSGYPEVTKEINLIVEDTKSLGLDINSAIERAIDRTPSKGFQDLLWGVLSTVRTGGDLARYLKEKADDLMQDYRRKLYEFSQTLSLYIEVYLIAIVLGSIFFTILTGIMAGIGGGGGSIMSLQFMLIFVFIPLVSIAFLYLVKTSAPSSE
jgi:flagellar protein FlaJ